MEPLKKSVEELDELLPKGWREPRDGENKSGLQMATAQDGMSSGCLNCPDDRL